MPHQLQPSALVHAEAAVAFAQEVRAHHRRRTDKRSSQRRSDINLALSRIAQAMKPLRSEIGRFTYPQSGLTADQQQAVREASAALQRERRKLWKMKAR